MDIHDIYDSCTIAAVEILKLIAMPKLHANCSCKKMILLSGISCDRKYLLSSILQLCMQ